MDYYSNYTKGLPKPITIAIMIPLVMIFLFIVVPLVLFFATFLYIYLFFAKKKYKNNPHYQTLDKTILSKVKVFFGKFSRKKQPASEATVDVESKPVESEKLAK